jgi:hypothetical protein
MHRFLKRGWMAVSELAAFGHMLRGGADYPTSGFQEANANLVKPAIFSAAFTLRNPSTWRSGRFYLELERFEKFWLPNYTDAKSKEAFRRKDDCLSPNCALHAKRE